MKLVKKINVELNRKGFPKEIDVVQYDTGLQLKCIVKDFDIPNGTTATLYAEKPSGKFVYQKKGIEISDNTIIVDLENQAITEHGKVWTQITLSNGTDTISTFEMLMKVQKSRKDSGAVESTTVIRAFDEAIEKAVAQINEARDAASKYISESVDQSLSIAGKAADAAAVGKKVTELNEKLDNQNETIYNGEIEWVNGFYDNSTGVRNTNTAYKSSNRFPLYMYDVLNSYKFNEKGRYTEGYYSFISYWNNGEYVGYYLGKQYYDTTKTVVESLVYDEFAINLYATDFPNPENIKFACVGDIIRTKLYGKTLGLIGDSICKGAGYNGGYGKIIGEDYGMTVNNFGVNGATIVPGEYSQILQQYESLTEENDYILLEGGFNDAWMELPLGEYNPSYSTPTADGTFYGNLNYLLYLLVHDFSYKKFGYIIVHKSREQYSDINDSYGYYNATVKLCKKWGVPICDLNANCPPLGLVSTSDILRTTNTLNADGVHPNELGYRTFYVPKIVEFMLSL